MLVPFPMIWRNALDAWWAPSRAGKMTTASTLRTKLLQTDAIAAAHVSHNERTLALRKALSRAGKRGEAQQK